MRTELSGARGWRLVSPMLWMALCAVPFAGNAQTSPPNLHLPPNLPIIFPSTPTTPTTEYRTSAIRTNAGFTQFSVPRNDDESGPLVPIGFDINFFGRTRSMLYVNNNGNVTLDSALSTFTPFGPSIDREIIAAFFADVDTRPTGCR